MADKPLEVVSETQDTITFKYATVSGADGYRFYADDKAVSRTFDATRTTVKFSKGAERYRVVPVDVSERADGYVHPAPATPPPPPPGARKVAEAVYDGYADAGDVPLWKPHGEQVKADDRLTIVDDPLGQRGKVMRVHVKPGDTNVAGSGTGERAEVMCGSAVTPDGEGEIVASRTSFMLPTDFQSNGSQWNAIHQWHGTGSGGQPNIFLSVRNGKDLDLRIMGRQASSPWRADIALGALSKGRWYDLAISELLSADPAKGRIMVALNGNQIVDRACASKYTDQGRYWKQGMYRVGGQSYTVTLFMGPTSFWTAATVADALAAAIRA